MIRCAGYLIRLKSVLPNRFDIEAESMEVCLATKGMIAGLVTATIVGVVFIVMMNEGCLATYRASRIFMNYSGTWSFRCELVITVTA